jgi:hypothetical protein
MMGRDRTAALERFERAVELPLLVLALLMVPLLVVPLVVELSPGAEQVVVALDWFVWAAFALEYVVRPALTERRWRFVRREWPDLFRARRRNRPLSGPFRLRHPPGAAETRPQPGFLPQPASRSGFLPQPPGEGARGEWCGSGGQWG